MKPALAQALTEIQISPTEVQAIARTGDDQVLYFELPGEKALAAWKTLSGRIEQTGYTPVIMGEYARRRRGGDPRYPSRSPSPAKIIKLSTKIDPQAWLQKKFDRERESLELMLRADPDFKWPLEAHAASHTLRTHCDYKGRPLQQCGLGLVPTNDPNVIPAYLAFGGFNECPKPAVHVAMLRYWSRRYRSRVACMTHDVLEAVVDSPPTSQEEAMHLAQEYHAYCNDIVSQNMRHLPMLAVELWQSPVWYFWWD